MPKKKVTIVLGVCIILVATIAIVVWYNITPETDDMHAFEWKMVQQMIASGALSNEKYSVEEIPLHYLQISDARIFFVVDKQFEALLGPKQAVVVYDSESKVLYNDQEHLKMLIQSHRYELKSPDELLQLAEEIVPLWYGSKPAQHEILSKCNLVASGVLPVTKEIFQKPYGPNGVFVSYFAKIGPWGDIVNATIVLQAGRLRIALVPIYLSGL